MEGEELTPWTKDIFGLVYPIALNIWIPPIRDGVPSDKVYHIYKEFVKILETNGIEIEGPINSKTTINNVTLSANILGIKAIKILDFFIPIKKDREKSYINMDIYKIENSEYHLVGELCWDVAEEKWYLYDYSIHSTFF